MKILFVVGPPDSPTHCAVAPVIRELERRGWTIEVFHLGFDGSMVTPPDPSRWDREIDLTYYGYAGQFLRLSGVYCPRCPTIGHVWYFHPERAPTHQLRTLETWDRVLVPDWETARALYRVGVEHCTHVDHIHDPERYRPLPLPGGPFTVATFGNEYQVANPRFGKRAIVLEQAAKAAEVQHFVLTPDPTRVHYDLDLNESLYSRIHLYVHPGLLDTCSLPVLEALACGRPVLVTHAPGFVGRVVDGVNGRYFDGSIGDLTAKLKELREGWSLLRPQDVVQPSLSMVTDAYEAVFRGVL